MMRGFNVVRIRQNMAWPIQDRGSPQGALDPDLRYAATHMNTKEQNGFELRSSGWLAIATFYDFNEYTHNHLFDAADCCSAKLGTSGGRADLR